MLIFLFPVILETIFIVTVYFSVVSGFVRYKLWFAIFVPFFIVYIICPFSSVFRLSSLPLSNFTLTVVFFNILPSESTYLILIFLATLYPIVIVLSVMIVFNIVTKLITLLFS